MEYVDNKNCNIKNYDAYIRLASAIIIITLVLYIKSYFLLLLLVPLLLYTGLKRHCYIYDIFSKNGKFSMRNFYMSQLPKFDSSSTFVFNTKGELYFKNKSAKQKLSHIKAFKDFKLNISVDKLENKQEYTFYYSYQELHYQLNLQVINDTSSVLVYAVDITQIVNLNYEIEKTQKEIIYTMGEIAEKRSQETGHHVKRVAEYSQTLALLYGLDTDEAKMLKLASPMHDIGKIAVPDNILNKPGKLTDNEYTAIQEHAQLGFDMLKNSDRPIIKTAAIVAQQHHEKYDGTGYPNGLKGEDIHIYGRITAIVDVFDALFSERTYKKAWNLNDVLQLLSEERGKHFDPLLIDLFLKNIDTFLEIKNKYR